MNDELGQDPIGRLRGDLDAALATRDKPAAVAAAVAAVESGQVDIPSLYARVLTPLMADVGAAWRAGSTCVWEEHLASSTARTIVEVLYPHVRRLADAVPPAGYTAVLACPPDETHDLGLRMLADRLELAGWRVHLLGADTPGPEIGAAARALGADLVVLSSATHFHRVRVRALADALALEVPSARVVVTGAAFRAAVEGFAADEVLDEDGLARLARMRKA